MVLQDRVKEEEKNRKRPDLCDAGCVEGKALLLVFRMQSTVTRLWGRTAQTRLLSRSSTERYDFPGMMEDMGSRVGQAWSRRTGTWRSLPSGSKMGTLQGMSNGRKGAMKCRRRNLKMDGGRRNQSRLPLDRLRSSESKEDVLVSRGKTYTKLMKARSVYLDM